jgi:two-component system, OmpR family, copper resistance phosphate regulon response regulator CusR
MRILIAEDDEALAKFVRQGLEGEHYVVDVVADGEQARSLAINSEYELLVLDLNLPKLDGVTVLRQLRLKKPSMPVLILTQRTKIEDRVQCLDTGADDYLAKPFSFSELSARIRALLRRSHLPSESVLVVGDLKLDRVQRIVERAGAKIDLTAKEFSLLEYLMHSAGREVTRSMIIEHVWNLSFDTTTNVVDVYINYSRVVFNVGNAVASANSQQSASNLVLQQLNNQRSSVSGVSLDEEAANLIRYQQAYAASAKVVSTINSMMETVIAMKS